MITSEIKITGKKNLLDACVASLEPEQEFKNERASYELTRLNKQLIITIQAQDLNAFRAVTNSVTSLLSIVNQNWSKIENER
jgi:tRNA threonylcarbamoyladenosine modification (KEOPS) complex  Pcc1 subunit